MPAMVSFYSCITGQEKAFNLDPDGTRLKRNFHENVIVRVRGKKDVGPCYCSFASFVVFK